MERPEANSIARTAKYATFGAVYVIDVPMRQQSRQLRRKEQIQFARSQ